MVPIGEGTWAIALVAIFGEPLKALFLPPKLEHGADDGCAGRPARLRRASPRRLEVGPGAILHQGPEEDAQADQRPLGDHRQVGNVQGGLRRAPLPCPAPAYYEWRDDPDGKTPFAVARIDGEPVVFGGIWERWKSPDGEILQTFATITTDANRQLAGIQDRMPVIIERGDRPLWLGETAGDLGSLLRPAPEDVLRVGGLERRSATSGTRTPVARANSRYGTDANLMRSSRPTREQSLILCLSASRGPDTWRTTRSLWTI